jgi:hypothetical protein
VENGGGGGGVGRLKVDICQKNKLSLGPMMIPVTVAMMR